MDCAVNVSIAWSRTTSQRIPSAAAEDSLLTPRPGTACRLGPHPPGLALLRPEQAVQEQAG